MQNQKEIIMPKLKNIIDLYYNLETAEDKNILLKSIISKVTYLKTEKAIKKDSDPTNFELHIYQPCKHKLTNKQLHYGTAICKIFPKHR